MQAPTTSGYSGYQHTTSELVGINIGGIGTVGINIKGLYTHSKDASQNKSLSRPS